MKNIKKTFRLTFDNGKSRILEYAGDLENVCNAVLHQMLSDGSGEELHRCVSVSEVLDRKMALEVLDKLDGFRRDHYYDAPATPDWCMRAMEAIVAQAAGYDSRTDWTEALKVAPQSRYARDLRDTSMQVSF